MIIVRPQQDTKTKILMKSVLSENTCSTRDFLHKISRTQTKKIKKYHRQRRLVGNGRLNELNTGYAPS